METAKRLPVHMEEERAIRGPMDLPFLILVVLILSVGLIMVFSASYASAYYTYDNPAYLFFRQGIFALGGAAAMIVISFMDYRNFRKWAFLALVASIVLLVLVLFIGKTVNGAKRWIDLGPFGFQPSEVAKLAVILCFATMIEHYKEKMRTLRYGILPFGLILGVIGFLMFKEPHLSGTVLIFATGAALMFVGGVRVGWFLGAGLAVGGAAWVLVNNMGYAMDRINIWKDPFIDARDKGYQTIQSLYAVGSGGLMGLGLGRSRQKFLYLPEQHNDFVFAIVCEELGFVGACLVLLLFALLIVRGYWIALHSRDRFGTLIVIGITTLLALQVFLNIAVVTNLFPVTGVSLPFFSYGGTSLMIQLAEMGIILSVSRQMPAKPAG